MFIHFGETFAGLTCVRAHPIYCGIYQLMLQLEGFPWVAKKNRKKIKKYPLTDIGREGIILALSGKKW
jgi:hypothetical protein